MENRLQEFRKKAKLSQAALAEKSKTSQPQIDRLEKGDRKLTVEWAERLAPHLNTSPRELLFSKAGNAEHAELVNLRVEGIVEAGNFRDVTLTVDHESEKPEISVVKDKRFPSSRQYALLVSGDSMDRRFPNGCYVTCARWNDTGLELKPGMILHVERVRMADLVETTVKQYAERDGSRWLDPDSTNPAHKPIPINGDADTEIHIRGLVTGLWNPLEY